MKDRLQSLKPPVSMNAFAKSFDLSKCFTFSCLTCWGTTTLPICVWNDHDSRNASNRGNWQFLYQYIVILQADLEDDETQDFDESTTVVNVENTFMDQFFQHVSSVLLCIPYTFKNMYVISKSVFCMLSFFSVRLLQ